MIIFKYVRWKNFLSTGNQFTEIQLDRNSTTLIIGENGAGKSTILDALCFGLFGKPFRNINKPQLLNSVNGSGCLVEIEFKIGSKEPNWPSRLNTNISQSLSEWHEHKLKRVPSSLPPRKIVSLRFAA